MNGTKCSDNFPSGRLGKTIFAFPGQGSSGPLPLSFLKTRLPVFREYVERAEYYLQIKGIYPDLCNLLNAAKISSPLEGQLFPFIFGVAAAQQFISYGITPDALLGHSIGEAAALVVAGLTDYEDTLRYISDRAAAISKIHGKGAMMFAAISEAEAIKLTADFKNLSIAAVNSPKSTVISGKLNELKKVEITMDKQNIRHKRIRVPFAAHSPMLNPVMDELLQISPPYVSGKAKFPIYSSLNRGLFSCDDACDPVWWGTHCRETVRFMDALLSIEKSAESNDLTFVEFGVHRTLAPGCIETLPHSKWHTAFAMSSYIPDKSREYCFQHGIEETLLGLGIEKYNVYEFCHDSEKLHKMRKINESQT